MPALMAKPNYHPWRWIRPSLDGMTMPWSLAGRLGHGSAEDKSEYFAGLTHPANERSGKFGNPAFFDLGENHETAHRIHSSFVR